MNKGSGVTAPKGFIAAGLHCGIKPDGASDLALIFSQAPAIAWGAFTLNKVKGAPVLLNKAHLKSASTRAIVVNSGNANTLLLDGYENAVQMARVTSDRLGIKPSETLVASTGVIGQPLPIKKIERGIMDVASHLRPGGGKDAARAIMTTDTRLKEASKSFVMGSRRVTVGGCAKGSGMVHPDMATMLAFVTTDAAISKPVIKEIVKRANEVSFNSITVDGETSTSDMFILLANSASGASLIEKPSGAQYSKLLDKVSAVCIDLAQKIAHDGEGATKFITVDVAGAKDYGSAHKVAKRIARSNLVKTAMFGEDANWGRILCAAGCAGVDIDPMKSTLKIGGVAIFRKGSLASADWEKKVRPHIKKKNIKISLDLGYGKAKARVWTCDMTYDYIKINADYRT